MTDSFTIRCTPAPAAALIKASSRSTWPGTLGVMSASTSTSATAGA